MKMAGAIAPAVLLLTIFLLPDIMVSIKAPGGTCNEKL